jgi:hypothetical protein
MSNITLRLVKQSPLTNQELDNNFANLNADKYQSGDAADLQSVTLSGMSGGMTWNNNQGTVDVPLSNDVTLQLGQEFVFYAKATEAISNGDVVMFAGAQGGHLLISKCDMSAPNFHPTHIVGVATQDFSNNEFGYATSLGKVRDLDTSDYDEGTILFVSADEAGGLTTTQPSPPNHIVQIAVVVKSHQNNGELLVRATHTADTDEIPEGASNLYFTTQRAINAINSSDTYNRAQWDEAYEWGDHAGLYLPIDEDTLPDQGAYAGKFLTTDGANASWATVDTTNGDTAFSWGDHAQAGYATTVSLNSEVVTLNNTITALSDSIAGQVQEATDQAVIATAQAVIATNKATEAQGFVNDASDKADEAEAFRDTTKTYRDEVNTQYNVLVNIDEQAIADNASAATASATAAGLSQVAAAASAQAASISEGNASTSAAEAAASADVYTDVQESLVTMASNIISTQAIVVEHHAFS